MAIRNLTTEDIQSTTDREELTALDSDDILLVYDQTDGKIKRISKANLTDTMGIIDNTGDIADLQSSKADADNVYTKTESDALLDDKTDKTTTNALDLRVTQNESDIDNRYTKTESDALLADKADESDVTALATRVGDNETNISDHETRISDNKTKN